MVLHFLEISLLQRLFLPQSMKPFMSLCILLLDVGNKISKDTSIKEAECFANLLMLY